jgi:hypothetical protein
MRIIALFALVAAATHHSSYAACVSIADDLRRMLAVDQAIRELIRPEEMAAMPSAKRDIPKSFQRMMIIDKQHQTALLQIVSKCGWPRRSVVGEAATGAAWMLAQHAEPKTQLLLLPHLERAVAANDASGSDLAYLTDRVRINGGQLQMYGTQLDIKPPCKVSILPVEDEAGLNLRREKMRMPPIETYIAQVRQHFATQGCPQE